MANTNVGHLEGGVSLYFFLLSHSDTARLSKKILGFIQQNILSF